MWEQLLSFSFFTLVLALSPGPDNIFVLTQSLSNGIKSGLATTAGLISGCIVHTSLLAFGVSAILATSHTTLFTIKGIGAAYLFFLAYKVLRSHSKINLAQKNTTKSYLKLFKTGVVMNLMNPKVLLFFLAFFPSFLWDTTGNTVVQFYILGGVFMAVSLLVFSGFAFFAGSVSSFLLNYRYTELYLKWLQIIVFMGIGIYILFF